MSDDFDRREFLKRSAAVVAVAAVTSGSVYAEQKASFAGGVSKSLVKIQGKGVVADVGKAVSEVLKPLGGMKAFVKKGDKVVLKPNMGFATDASIHATTSPQVVAAVAREVLACSPAKVLILDVPMRNPEACLRRNGIKAACKGLDVQVVLPTSERFFVSVDIPKGKILKKVKILRDVMECDVHIPIPVAKSHMAAGFSGGVKGNMGVILDRESFHSRYELNQAIADLATGIKSHLSILDGLMVMSEGGPAGPGKLIAANAIVAGTDIVAVDAMGVVLAPLYGRKIKPRQIRHLKKAQLSGVGKLKVSKDNYVQLSM